MAINTFSILKKASSALNKNTTATKIRDTLRDLGYDAAVSIAKKINRNFENSPTSRELLRGPSARTSVSDFPNGKRDSRYGNLSAYFGLDSAKVVSDFEAIKLLFATYRVTVKGSAGNYQVKIEFPTIDAFYSVTPPPENAYPLSWLEAMEKARLQNFAQFLFRREGIEGSRTGTGLQVKAELRTNAQSFPKIPFVSKILKESASDGQLILREVVRNQFKRRMK